MPDGLLDPLTLEEIADLFAYLQVAVRRLADAAACGTGEA